MIGLLQSQMLGFYLRPEMGLRIPLLLDARSTLPPSEVRTVRSISYGVCCWPMNIAVTHVVLPNHEKHFGSGEIMDKSNIRALQSDCVRLHAMDT